jgi:hypothetical protein
MRPSLRLSAIPNLGILALLGGVACSGELAPGGPGSSAEPGSTPAATPGEMPDVPQVDNPSQGPTEFSCDPTFARPDLGMRRLTHRQYVNTLTDLLVLTVGESSAESVFGELAPVLDSVPEDERAPLPEDLHGTFRRLDQAVQQSHVDAWYEAGVRAGQILSRPEHLEAVVGSCVTSASGPEADACVTSFIERFGRSALRRPLSAEEVSFYHDVYAPSSDIDPAGFADVIAAMLNAPQFLYLVEHASDTAAVPSDSYLLSPHELAARLSYHFWETMPDESLSALADSGALLEPDVYAGEVERLFADGRTRDTLHAFYREWMKLEELPTLDSGNDARIFQAFAGEDLPSPELRAAMIDEVVDLLDYYTWQEPGGIEQILTSNYSFARSEELAGLYGVPAWDGSNPPPSFAESRPGLLTRAAFLSTGTANTRPIMKGLFIRRTLLCDQIPPPPENAMAIPPDLDPELSTRQVVEALTETPGTSCASCHAVFMNPLGFATEGFDSLGRPRTVQRLFDGAGTLLGEVPVDTTSVPQVVSGDATVSEGPSDLMTLIADSGKASACAARHYDRFSFGRWESVVDDGCVLEQMRVALDETGGLAGMLRSVALSEAFRRRTVNLDGAPNEGGQ